MRDRLRKLAKALQQFEVLCSRIYSSLRVLQEQYPNHTDEIEEILAELGVCISMGPTLPNFKKRFTELNDRVNRLIDTVREEEKQ